MTSPLTPGHRPVVGAMSLQGHMTETGEPITILGMETPIPGMRANGRIDKITLERAHLERFRSDYLLATGILPFDNVRPGDDPPDFVIQTAYGDVGLDCAAIGLERRRRAYRLFADLRRRLLDVTNDIDLSHLRNTVILVWFGGGNDLPPKRSDREVVESLVTTMSDCRLIGTGSRSSASTWPSTGSPERFPEGAAAIFNAPDNAAGFNAVPVMPGELLGPFAEATGFACELSMSTEVRLSDLRAEIDRLLVQHDRVGTDHVLLTLGAPDPDGLRYPAEEQLAALMTEEFMTTPPLRHIRRVSLHVWSQGALGEFAVSSAWHQDGHRPPW